MSRNQMRTYESLESNSKWALQYDNVSHAWCFGEAFSYIFPHHSLAQNIENPQPKQNFRKLFRLVEPPGRGAKC